MSIESATTRTLPGKTIALQLGRNQITSRASLTDGTFVMTFQDAQRYLSAKPLKRPGRTRPLA
jgi:hypothetical protein